MQHALLVLLVDLAQLLFGSPLPGMVAEEPPKSGGRAALRADDRDRERGVVRAPVPGPQGSFPVARLVFPRQRERANLVRIALKARIFLYRALVTLKDCMPHGPIS